MKWLRRHRDDLVLVVLILGMAVAVFVFFKTFFDAGPDELTTEILAALLGSIITVMITMLLIKRQGSIEQAQEGAATSKTKVFEKKLELFRQFISIYVQSAADNELDAEELEKLEELALTISLFTKDLPVGDIQKDLGEEICRFVLQLQIFGLQTQLRESDFLVFDQHLQATNASGTRRLLRFVDILSGMKVELGIAQSDTNDLDGPLGILEEYEWAQKLLEYRAYRGADAPDSPETRKSNEA